ncbi:lactadherin-like [Patiria miniata]|uniref:F5/8 type C domain-containing protein n=1 Tax=Patiria miniata TaxID=46514 RepID=A0A914A6N2_PATMI|nr:lactadherin-like [Patiria miniata]
MHSAYGEVDIILLSGVESGCVKARVCYFGPPPEPDPENPDQWMKQVMQEIRDRCPGLREPTPTAKVLCRQPLGMEDGTINNDRVSASSSGTCCPASGARLNAESRWIPEIPEGSWIKVDLVQSTVVSGVVTQGYYVGFVTHFMVAYQNQPPSAYEYLTDGNGNKKVFTGSTVPGTPVTNLFNESVLATEVRIEPTAWDSNVALRLELLGCPLD